MKKTYTIAAIIVVIILVASCGKKDESTTIIADYQEVAHKTGIGITGDTVMTHNIEISSSPYTVTISRKADKESVVIDAKTISTTTTSLPYVCKARLASYPTNHSTNQISSLMWIHASSNRSIAF